MKTFNILFVQVFFCTFLSAQNIYSIVGDGTNGYGNGDNVLATSSEINRVSGNIAMDAAGNIFIPDNDNHRIRRVDALTGIITTVAGTGVNGYNGDGILAVNAQLNNPNAIALDGAGNIYIADYSNNRIRKVTASSGLISTIAGTGVYGYSGDGLLGTLSKICESTGIAVNSLGDVYFSDMGNARIRKISASNGFLYNVAGTGTQGYNGDNISALTAQLNFPYGIAFDNSGNLLVAERQGHRIRKINLSSGLISTVAGNGSTGYNGDGISATTATINWPWSVTADAFGNFYIADDQNNRIRKVNNAGIISTVAGNGTFGSSGNGGPAISAQIAYPRGVFIDQCGNIYISEYWDGRIRQVSSYAVNITKTDVTCFGACNGTLSVTVSGGIGPYSYSWSGGLGTSANQTNVCPGNYTLTVTDATGCVVNVPVSITEPPALTVSISNTNASSCFLSDASATAIVNGGIPNYSYLWSTSSTNNSISNVAAGNYSVTVTDANGCVTTQSVTIINNPTPPSSTPICLVTVDPVSQYNVIVWDKTSAIHIDSFIVYREITTNTYQRIGAVPYDSLSQFIDTVRTLYFPNTGDPNAGTYRYKIAALDSCGISSIMCPYHNTIYISQNAGTFSWPALYAIEGGPNPVMSYVLLRDNLSNGTWVPVSSVAGTQQTVSDPAYATYAATASWRVQTFWSITCTPSFRSSNPADLASLNASLSNIQGNFVPLGTGTINLGNEINIYPTVGEGVFTLEVANCSNSKIEVYSALGELVYSSFISTNKSEINLSEIGKGIYLLHIISENGIVVKKVIVE